MATAVENGVHGNFNVEVDMEETGLECTAKAHGGSINTGYLTDEGAAALSFFWRMNHRVQQA